MIILEGMVAAQKEIIREILEHVGLLADVCQPGPKTPMDKLLLTANQ